MDNSISTLLTRNLYDVFVEIDPVRRRAAIDEIFAEDCVFYDPLGGVYRGHDAIDRVAGEAGLPLFICSLTSSRERPVRIVPSRVGRA